ncbi:hypothetical protein LSAT2_002183 [Lamellibrachia satsuma]|nr:hypothetical protein LSAT2_002183 [Lamellibrachia satsuma]
MLWGAVVAFIITVVAMATPNWVVFEGISLGLWKVCQYSICVELPASYLPSSMKGIQAFVCLSLIASIGTLLLAILYTFVHYVSKRLVQLLFIVAAALAAMFMLGGFAWFAAKAKEHFAYSFYLAVVAFVLHVVVAILLSGISFHDNIKGTVYYDGATSEPFEIRSGVKQGCVLANIYTNRWETAADDRGHWRLIVRNGIKKQNIKDLRNWLKRGNSESRGLHHFSRFPSPAASTAETVMPEWGY